MTSPCCWKLPALRKSFGSLKVADDLDLAIAPGEALGIIGPNGAGKTTLFNLIAGDLARRCGGSIRFDGSDITGMPPHQRCRAGIGRSYQIPQPFEKLTVFENLLVGAVLRPRARRSARSSQFCARDTGAHRPDGRANAPAGSLTLLERKRLEMARALATGAASCCCSTRSPAG